MANKRGSGKSVINKVSVVLLVLLFSVLMFTLATTYKSALETTFGLSKNILLSEYSNPFALKMRFKDISDTGYQKAELKIMQEPLHLLDNSIIPEISMKIGDKIYWSYDGTFKKFPQTTADFSEEIDKFCKTPIENKKNVLCLDSSCDCEMTGIFSFSHDNVKLVVALGDFVERPRPVEEGEEAEEGKEAKPEVGFEEEVEEQIEEAQKTPLIKKILIGGTALFIVLLIIYLIIINRKGDN